MQPRFNKTIFEISGALVALSLGSGGAIAVASPAPATASPATASPAAASSQPSPATFPLAPSPALIIAQGTPTAQQNQAERHFKRGIQQFQGRQLEAALKSWETALKLYRELGDRPGEAKTLGNLGNVFYSLRRYKLAVDFHRAHHKIAVELGDRQAEASSLGNLGNAYYSLEKLDQAIELHNQSLSIARDIGDRRLEAYALGNLGLAYRSLKQYEQAIDFHNQHRALSRSLGDRSGEASSLVNIGVAHFSLGQYEQAIEFYQQALAVKRAIGDRSGEASSLARIGNAYYALRQYEKAIELYNQSQKLRRSLGDRWGQAKSLGSIGNAYYALGEYQRAIEFHNRSRTISRDLGNFRGQLRSLSNLGNAYDALGQYQRAIRVQRQSLDIARKIGDYQGEANALGNLGNAYDSLGQYQRAIEFHNKSLKIKRSIGDRRGEANSLGNLGNVYDALGQYDRAIEFHNQSLNIDREVGDRQGEANSLGNLGNAYFVLGRHQRAIDFHNQALGLKRNADDQKGTATSLGNLGLAYHALGQHDRAIEFYNQSLEIAQSIGDRRGAAASLGNLGNVHSALGQHDRAVEFHSQSLRIARRVGDRPGEASALGNLGNTYSALGQLKQAESSLRQSLAVTEAIAADLGTNDRNRVSFFETGAATYSALQHLLVQQNKVGAALEIADRSRARSLTAFLAVSGGKKSSTAPRPAPRSASDSALNLSQIKRLARDRNATLVTYSIVDRSVYIWVVSPSGELNFATADPEEAGLSLRESVRNIRSAASIGGRGGQEFSPDKYRLDLRTVRGGNSDSPWVGRPENLKQGYSLLIKPIESYLPQEPGSRVIVVPHRELGTVPFAALIDDQNRFLIDRYTITVTPSLQTLQTLQGTRNTATGQPLIVGNPTPIPGEAAELGPLPSAEAEAQAIAQKLNATPVLGREATEAHIKSKLSDASILHFATHGIIPRSDSDLNSWLALANVTNDGEEDNKLTLSEVFNTQLNAQLAVLSACNTNSGEISGEGVLGLARAFLKAGVPTVVASSWKVPDRETKILMEEFYAQLLTGKTYAEALRAAQLKIRAQSPNPFKWAAFSVIGEGDRTLELP